MDQSEYNDLLSMFERSIIANDEGLAAHRKEQESQEAERIEKDRPRVEQYIKSLGPSAPSEAEFDYTTFLDSGLREQYDAHGTVLLPSRYYKMGGKEEPSIIDAARNNPFVNDIGFEIIGGALHGVTEGLTETLQFATEVGHEFIGAAGRGVTQRDTQGHEQRGQQIDQFFEDVDNPFPRPDSVSGALTSGISQFGAASGPVGWLLKKAGKKSLQVAVGSGIAGDMAAFDPKDANISGVLREIGQEYPEFSGLDNEFTEWLDSTEAEHPFEARLKNALEGAGLGLGVDAVMTAAKRLKRDGLREIISQMAEGGGPPGSPAAQLGQAAFHGSGAKFNKFDLAYLGTGEGVQAYGHGLYFAESPGTAKYYQETVGGAGVADKISNAIDRYVHGKNKNITDLLLLEGVPESYVTKEVSEIAERIAKATDITDGTVTDAALKDYRKLEELLPAGHLYEVDIPDEAIDRMLDWDKPLSEQPEIVKKLRNLSKTIDDSLLTNSLQDFELSSSTGASIYRALQNIGKKRYVQKSSAGNIPIDAATKDEALKAVGGDPSKLLIISEADAESASKALNSVGIPGIKFLDGSSRAAGEGTRNFVVFDDKLPTIIKRNGKPVKGGD